MDIMTAATIQAMEPILLTVLIGIRSQAVITMAIAQEAILTTVLTTTAPTGFTTKTTTFTARGLRVL